MAQEQQEQTETGAEVGLSSPQGELERLVMLQLTAREKSMVEFAVWRFMNDAFAQADFYAQKRPGRTATQALEDSEKARKFQRDADDAGKLVAKLRNTAT